MKKLLFTALSVCLLMGLCSCVNDNDPKMTPEVLGAGAPVFEEGSTEITGKTASSITVKAKIGKENGERITERGFFYGLNPLPSIENGGNQIKDSGVGIGDYALTIVGLSHNTHYYFRPYAINSKDTGFGAACETTTNIGAVDVSTLKPDVDSIRASYAIAGGEIKFAGEGDIHAMGVYLYEKGKPDGVDSVNYEASYPVTATTGTQFVCRLHGLTPATWYFVRAFVSNSYGKSTGDLDSLYTRDGKPVIGITTVEERDFTNVTLRSSVTNGDDETVTVIDRGFCWAVDTITSEPTLSNDFENMGNGSGAFTGKISGLKSNVKYYVRAYATSNFNITVYGEAILVQSKMDLPTVRTEIVTNMQYGNAVVGGVISDMGMTSVITSGICWSTTNTRPNISDDSFLPLIVTGNAFSGSLTGLKGGTTYYVRAYAKNEQGEGYGEVEQFTTPKVFTTGLAPFRGEDTRYSFAYFAIDWHLYILGGDLGASYTDELWSYSILNNNWERCRPFIGAPSKWQTGVSYGAAAYVYGGENGSGSEQPGVYHYMAPLENRWSYYDAVPADSAIVNKTVGYAYSNSIYFIGGMSADTVREDVWRYEVPYTNWRKMTDFPVKQYGGIAVVVDKVPYVGMGRDTVDVCNGSLWTTSDGATSWNLATTYPVTGNVLGGEVCNKRIYIIDESDYILEYNPETNVWTRKSRLPESHRKAVHCVYSVDNLLYIGLGSDKKSLIVYDPLWDN